jgi:hypothetical protein
MALVLAMSFSVPAGAQGTAVLTRMRDAYAGKWYRTLTFVQRTVITKPSGLADTTTWYETLNGARLRIDVGPPSAGNGALYSADSLIVIRDGKVARALDHGNPFLPLIMGVYLQPIAQTERELAGFGFDLTRQTTATWEGRPAIVVGVSDVADTTAAQFWIDTERLVLVRMRGNIKGIGDADIHLLGYERVGRGWLATRVRIATGPQVQTEEYSDWHADIPVSSALFDPAQWRTAPHWAKP